MSSLRLMETLNLLLNFTKVEAGKIELKINKVDIKKLVTETIALFEYPAIQKGIELKREIIPDDLKIYSDERIILQIMNNLVNNAIKYTKKGYIKLTIDEATKNNEAIMLIKVKDTGIGIPKEKQKLIWEEFRQVSEGISRNYVGTGLGLTITKRFVEKLGGSIEIESEVDSGTTFTVSIPKNTVVANIGEKSSVPKPSSFGAELGESGKDFDILYVENEEVSRKYVGYILRNIYNIDYAVYDKEAFEKLYNNKYKLILMDINLGKGMDGVELTKEIKKIPEYSNVPIIAVTAYALEDDKTEFLENGCVDYISKPFEKDDLLKMIKKYI
jgi:CheY-like chemotaxis protein